MRHLLARHLLASCLLPLPAMAQDAVAPDAVAPDAVAPDATVTEGNALAAPPAAWLGPEPHLVLMGALGGRPVDVQVMDPEAMAGLAAFSGKREYLPGEAGWRFGDFEVALQAEIGGVEKAFEVEVENRDFLQERPLPATFALGEENFPEGARAFLEVSAEWETGAGAVDEELGGWTGTLTLAEDSGTPDAEGLVPDGLIGGHMVAERGADRLVISFTVPVSGHEKDD